MTNTKFELTDQQQARMDAWFEHHWDIVHRDWHPPDKSGFAGFFMFGKTYEGCNVRYQCGWCDENNPHREVDLTEWDDGEFIYQYDKDWLRLPMKIG